MTSQGELKLPPELLQQIENPDIMDISLENGRIVLTPHNPETPEEIRKYLKNIGITEQDVADATKWARSK